MILDLHSSISKSTKILNKRDDIEFEIVNLPFLDGDVPRSTSYGVYIFFTLYNLLKHVAILLTF